MGDDIMDAITNQTKIVLKVYLRVKSVVEEDIRNNVESEREN
jgi:hypothetical protein